MLLQHTYAFHPLHPLFSGLFAQDVVEMLRARMLVTSKAGGGSFILYYRIAQDFLHYGGGCCILMFVALLW